MATGAWPSLFDLTSRINGAEKQVAIAEMLSQSNDVYDDLPFVEANEIGGHEFVYRTGLPAGVWRQYNQGVPYSKSTTAKGRVSLGTLEDYSQVDRMLAEDSGDKDLFRENEDVAFLEGMGQTIIQTLWYGNTAVTPAEFQGFSTFYNTVSTANAQNAANVIDGGGTGSSNASLWLVCWDPRKIFGLYPRGSKAGLQMEDKGDTTPAFDALGNRFEAYTSWYRQRMGLCPMDWRYAVRLANIDVTNAGLAGPNALDMFVAIGRMMMRPPTMTAKTSGITKTDDPKGDGGMRPVLYCNRTVRYWMDVQSIRDRNVLLSSTDYAGNAVTKFRDIPIKISDQLLGTEARVV